MIKADFWNGFRRLMLLPVQILSLEELLGSEDLWPILLGLTVVPTVLQMSFLPFCPESPRFLYIVRCQEHQAKRGDGPGVLLPLGECEFIAACTCAHWCRSEEVDREAGCGRHAGRDEGGEAEDGDGEEGLHPGAPSFATLPPTNCHFHPFAALAAALWDQRGECPWQLLPLILDESVEF